MDCTFIDSYTKIGEVASNFDYTVDDEIALRLKLEENTVAGYPCWDCHCMVWYDKNKSKYGCRVKKYSFVCDVFYKNTVKEIVEYVVQKHSAD